MPSLHQLEKLLALEPNDAFVLYAIAQEHAKARDHEKAIEYYDRCLGVDRLYCYAYYHKARSLEALGKLEDVRKTLEAGAGVAKEARDGKALSEMSSYLGAVS